MTFIKIDTFKIPEGIRFLINRYIATVVDGDVVRKYEVDYVSYYAYERAYAHLVSDKALNAFLKTGDTMIFMHGYWMIANEKQTLFSVLHDGKTHQFTNFGDAARFRYLTALTHIIQRKKECAKNKVIELPAASTKPIIFQFGDVVTRNHARWSHGLEDIWKGNKGVVTTATPPFLGRQSVTVQWDGSVKQLTYQSYELSHETIH